MASARTTPQVKVTSSPDIMGGEPCVAGTRIPARTIVAYLEGGYSDSDIHADYPSLPFGGIDAVRRWHAGQEAVA